jgi:hypothetical protein
VTRVSVETMMIVEAMRAVKREDCGREVYTSTEFCN